MLPAMLLNDPVLTRLRPLALLWGGGEVARLVLNVATYGDWDSWSPTTSAIWFAIGVLQCVAMVLWARATRSVACAIGALLWGVSTLIPLSIALGWFDSGAYSSWIGGLWATLWSVGGLGAALTAWSFGSAQPGATRTTRDLGLVAAIGSAVLAAVQLTDSTGSVSPQVYFWSDVLIGLCIIAVAALRFRATARPRL